MTTTIRRYFDEHDVDRLITSLKIGTQEERIGAKIELEILDVGIQADLDRLITKTARLSDVHVKIHEALKGQLK